MASAALRNLISAIACCASLAVAAAPHFPDQTRIRTQYHDGDFDKVIKELEAFQKSGAACTSAESLFLEKHLAVVYAANPTTRELGRYHMFRMLNLAPASDLLDMFVGEEVDAVFEKVRKEYTLRTGAKKNVPAPVAIAHAPAASVNAGWGRTNASLPAQPSRSSTAFSAPQSSWENVSASASAKSPAKASAHAAFIVHASAAPTLPAARTSVAPAKTAPAAWDDFASAPIGHSSQGLASSKLASAPGAPSGFSSSTSSPSSSSGNRPMEFHTGDAPAWKEPGLWIGGGAALAVVALTFFYSNSTVDAPPSKTYVVPASAAH